MPRRIAEPTDVAQERAEGQESSIYVAPGSSPLTTRTQKPLLIASDIAKVMNFMAATLARTGVPMHLPFVGRANHASIRSTLRKKRTKRERGGR